MQLSLCFLPVLLVAASGCGDIAAPVAPPDVTETVLLLGEPFAPKPAYARNVWDMQLFDGRIYIGHGDSQDNRGPITIWFLDPVSGVLSPEYETSEEQVDLFRVLDGSLYVPGHDPRDDLTLGNFYRLEDGRRWVKHRRIPHGLHAFDLAWYGNTLFAALGAEGKVGQETVLASADRGTTWTKATDFVERVYDLFQFRGVLYGAPLMGNARDAPGTLHRYNGTFVPTVLNGTTLLPGMPAGGYGRMLRAVEFSDQLVYIVARKTFDWIPLALAVGESVATTQRVALPDSTAVPTDLVIRDNVLYIASASTTSSGVTIRVYRTHDLRRFTELFHFSAPTFARSFEEHRGNFFFGLGSMYESPHAATGTILKVSRDSY